MGQNEGVLRSSAGVQYNDQLWHQLDVIRLGSRVDIRVNRNDVASENLWVNSDQDILKIDLGVFLGGYGEYNIFYIFTCYFFHKYFIVFNLLIAQNYSFILLDESVTGSHFDVSHPFFRGCIINAAFNGVDVLHPLHDVPNQKIIYNIKAGKLCFCNIYIIKNLDKLESTCMNQVSLFEPVIKVLMLTV